MDTLEQRSLAVAELQPIVTDVAAMAGTVDSIDVDDDETQGNLGDVVKLMMRRRSKLEQKRKSLVDPLNKVVKDINGLFKPPRDRIDQIIEIAKGKLNNYAQAKHAIEVEKSRLEREAARKERAEAEALAAALRAKVGEQEAAAIIERVQEQVETHTEEAAKPAKVAVVHGNVASISTPVTWKAQVVDIVALCQAVVDGHFPAHVIEPNMRALNDLARQVRQERTANGVRFYEQVSTTIR